MSAVIINNIQISVIIPVYNSGKTLNYALDAIKAQTRKPDELIIGYNNSTDNSLQIINNYSNEINIKIINIPSKIKGPAATRNYAAKHAIFNWLAFMDSDCAPLSNWLENAETLITKIDAAAFTGSVNGYLPESFFDKYQSVFGLNIINEDSLFEKFELFKTFGHTANFIVKREIFNDLNGFNEKLFFAEDHDFCARMLTSEKKYSLYFSNELTMRHIFRSDIKKFIHTTFFYNAAHSYLIKKYYNNLTVKLGKKNIIDCHSNFKIIINLTGFSVKIFVLIILCFVISKLMILPLLLYLSKINTRLYIKFGNAGFTKNYFETYKFTFIHILEHFTGLAGEIYGYARFIQRK